MIVLEKLIMLSMLSPHIHAPISGLSGGLGDCLIDWFRKPQCLVENVSAGIWSESQYSCADNAVIACMIHAHLMLFGYTVRLGCAESQNCMSSGPILQHRHDVPCSQHSPELELTSPLHSSKPSHNSYSRRLPAQPRT